MTFKIRRNLLYMTVFAFTIYGLIVLHNIKVHIIGREAVTSYISYDGSLPLHTESIVDIDHHDNDIGVTTKRPNINLNKTEKPKVDTQQKKIPLTVVVGSMRGGTTFTADIMNSYPGTFYVFEPLQSVSVLLGNNNTVLYMNGTSRNYSSIEEKDRVKAEMVRNWLTCNMVNIDLGAMTHSHMLYHSKRLSRHYQCQRSNGGKREKILEKCIPWLKSQCESGKARTLKIITMSMQASKMLLEILPEVKIIYVFRDPRAIINSQIASGLVDPRLVGKYSKHFCELMLNDIKRLENSSDVNLQPVIYERLADDPIGKAKLLYKFAGLNFVQAVESFVKSSSLQTGKLLGCKWCSRKGDSKLTSRQWRKKISFDKFRVIQGNCISVLNKLGYIAIDDENRLRDANVAVFETVKFTENWL